MKDKNKMSMVPTLEILFDISPTIYKHFEKSELKKNTSIRVNENLELCGEDEDDLKKDENKMEIIEEPSTVIKLQKRKVVMGSYDPQKKNCVEKGKTSLVCGECKRKLKITNNYSCRCGNMYCIRHRFHDQHSCTFDYKTIAIAKLEAQNPKIVGKRIGDFQ